MGTQITTKKVETLEDDDDDAEDLDADVTPLFDLGRNKKTKTVVRIAIKRTDPDEGHLGYLGPEASEHEIAHKWGGGEFVAQGKNAAGQIVVTQTIKIAGDPVFKSEIEEARWRRLNNLKPSKRREDDAGGGTLKEVLTLLEEREAKRRDEERDRRAAERQENLDREDRNRKEQRDHEEKLAREMAERDERRRQDDAERTERQRQQHREDLDRAEAANKAQLAQTQQFFTQLQAITKREDRAADGSDPLKMLTAGMELAIKMRGGEGGSGEPTDALTALVARLPETLSEIRSTAKEAYQEIKGKKTAAAAPARTGGPDEVTITGATATRLKRMIGILQKAGKDPEQVLDGLATHVIGLAAKKPAAPRAARAPAAAAARTTAKPAKKRAAPRAARAPAAAPKKRQTKKVST
jgi:hypothetical protein